MGQCIKANDLQGPRAHRLAPHSRTVTISEAKHVGVAFSFAEKLKQSVFLRWRIRDTATDVSDLARPVEPHSVGPALGLRWRAFPCEGS